MRLTILVCAALIGAAASAEACEVRLQVAHGDLSLGEPAGRAALRQRVAEAARSYCAAHGAEITPYESRADPYYCPDMLRSWIVGAMSPELRHAYALARREAGVRGRRL